MIVLDMTKARVAVFFVFEMDANRDSEDWTFMGIGRGVSEAEVRRAAKTAWGADREYLILPYTDAAKMIDNQGGEVPSGG